MNIVSGIAGSGMQATLKQFLSSMPPVAESREGLLTPEYSIGAVSQAPLKRMDPTQKGGLYGARKFLRAMKVLTRSDPNGVYKGDPLPQPSRLLSKAQRQIRFGYAPSPRARSSNARGRKTAVMRAMIFRAGKRNLYRELFGEDMPPIEVEA